MSDIKWGDRLEKAKKFREGYINHGKNVYKVYKDKREDDMTGLKKANFFYSNVTILKESLFNSLPKVDVKRIQQGNFQDDRSRVAAMIVRRGLTYEVDCMPHFEEAVTMAILDRLVPGLGQVWISFDMKKDKRKDEDTGEEIEETVAGTEQIKIDHVQWCDFIYGPAKKWSAVPWVGRNLHLTKEQIEDRWGKDAIAKVAAPNNGTEYASESQKAINADTFDVYEIWDKKTKKVYFYGGGEGNIHEMDAPYDLKKFWPCPRPLIANVTSDEFIPVTDYHLAQDQYNVLNTIYARRNLIIKAIKVAGIYNAASMDIQRMMTSQENVLIPCDNWAMMAENGGVKGQIEWYPVENVATVLLHLNQEFEAAKAMLYEITGMSDIIRGASNQYETASAQQIKAQFASVRMNGYQRDVSIFVRDALRIIAEMMVQLYSDEKLIAIVGELPEPDMQYAQEAVAMLRDDVLSSYKVTIQANSLTQADWALEKTQRVEMVQMLGQMIQGVMAGAQAAPELAVLGVQMIKFTVAGFKGADEFEGYVDQVLDDMLMAQQQAKANPQPKPPSPEEQKAQAEMQKMQMEGQMKQAEFQATQAAEQTRAQMEMQKMQAEMQFKQELSGMQMQLEEQKAQMEIQRMQAELEHKERMYALEVQMQLLKLELEGRKAEMGLQVNAAKAEQTLATNEASNAQKLEQQKQQAELKKNEPKPKEK